MQKFHNYLKEIAACPKATVWNENRNLITCWRDCERGDWMLWLMKRASMCDLQTFTLAKARCAELAKPYMKDERSLAALQAAFDFAGGRITEQQLRVYASAAADAAYAAAEPDAYNDTASVATYAAYAATVAPTAYTDYVDAAYVAETASDADANAAAAAYASAATVYTDAAAIAAACAIAYYAAAIGTHDIITAYFNILKQCATFCREVLPIPSIKGVK